MGARHRCLTGRKKKLLKTAPYCHFCHKKLNRNCHVEIMMINDCPNAIIFCSVCRKLHKKLIWPNGCLSVKELQVFRRKLLERLPVCHYCQCTLTYQMSTLDHKIPVSEGGQSCKNNLVLSCKTCNADKGVIKYKVFRMMKTYERRVIYKGDQIMNPSDSYYLGRNLDLGGAVESGSPSARQLDIRLQAYRLWELAGKPKGDGRQFWVQAERDFEEMVQGW